MLQRILLTLILVGTAGLTQVQAQCDPGNGLGGTGADVMVGELPNRSNYGTAGGYAAYSIGTTSCNIGTVELLWIANNNNHPVIAMNMYRMKDNKFEHIGASWLKHGFTALQGNTCSCGCISSGTGSRLGIGCSDPYGSGLNGSQGSLGPRYQVNATNGFFNYPPAMNPTVTDLTSGRIRVPVNDVNPALNSGANYFVEGHYVAPDDAAAGNAGNNASYRRVTVSGGSTFPINFSGNTVRQLPAIFGWQALDAAVVIRDLTTDEAGSDIGRVVMGYKVVDNGNGTWDYSYSVQNVSSHRSFRSFSVPVPSGVNLTNIAFSGPEYHSGEPYNNIAWVDTRDSNSITWDMQGGTDDTAYALRWSSVYSFSFTANAGPTATSATMDYFRSGGATDLSISTEAPNGTFLMPVTGLSCSANGTDIDMSWTNGDTYTSVEIRRAGAIIATLPGTATSHTETGLIIGTHNYQVFGKDGGASAAPANCSAEVLPAPPLDFTLTVQSQSADYNESTGVGSFTNGVNLIESAANMGFPNEVAGFSFGIEHDPSLLTATAVNTGSIFDSMNGGTGPSFVQPYVLANGVGIGVVFDFMLTQFLDASSSEEIATVDYDTVAANLAGDTNGENTVLTLVDTLGAPPIETVIAVGSDAIIPTKVNGVLVLNPTSGSQQFVRGDCNDDGSNNIADAIHLLGNLFPNGSPSVLNCVDACDSNDDGLINIADAIAYLSSIFGSPTTPLPAPTSCGSDPTPGDPLDCASFSGC